MTMKAEERLAKEATTDNVSLRVMMWNDIPVLVESSVSPQQVWLVNPNNVFARPHFLRELPWYVRCWLWLRPLCASWREDEPAFKRWRGKKYYVDPDTTPIFDVK